MNRYMERKHAIHAFSPDHVPATSARPGRTLIFEIYDCHMEQLLRERSNFDHMDKSLANPATGPVYTEGVCPQDILRLAVRNIELDRVGILDKGSTVGALKEYFPEYTIKRPPAKDDMVYYGHLRIPVRPMIDVIDTAPKGHAVSALAPGDHGGSVDCTSTGLSAVLYLPVRVPGAFSVMGDLHTVMGNGEYGNCGMGTGGRVTVQVDMVKSHSILWPLVETGGRRIATASRENADKAYQEAVGQMLTFLTVGAGFSKLDTGMSIDTLGNLVVYQVINPQEVVRLEMSKRPLGKLGFYGSVDQEPITHDLKEEQEVRS